MQKSFRFAKLAERSIMHVADFVSIVEEVRLLTKPA